MLLNPLNLLLNLLGTLLNLPGTLFCLLCILLVPFGTSFITP